MRGCSVFLMIFICMLSTFAVIFAANILKKNDSEIACPITEYTY